MVFVVKSECDEYELPLKKTDGILLLQKLQKKLETHKSPLRPRSISHMLFSLRRDKILITDLYHVQRFELEAVIPPGETTNSLVAFCRLPSVTFC